MASEITIKAQTIEVTDVGNVIISEISQPVPGGDWIREIRIFNNPPTEEVATEVLVLRMTGPARSALRITSPTTEF